MRKRIIAILLVMVGLLEGCGGPLINKSDDNVWMKEREAIITFWNPNYARGISYNASTSSLTDILTYSDEQIDKYIEMLKFCGFTGVQLTEMCAAWGGVSGYEFANQQMRKFAESAHKHKMKVTLWVWGAEFSDFGWSDSSAKYVTYDKNCTYAYEDPLVYNTFDKYYDIYASLADCSDRVIMHFFDPGNLITSEDIVYFANMFREKVRAVNPKADFGISCWHKDTDPQTLLDTLGNDITLYETATPTNGMDAVLFRNTVKESGARLGTWSWGTIEREVDQLAQWNYNAEYIKNTYTLMAGCDSVMKPEYWSEMDSYHVLNVFSLYAAGHLLQDYSQDTDKLTLDVAKATVGPEKAEQFAGVLRLVEKARTGATAETMDWESENYVLLSDAYPYDEILAECEELIPFVEGLITSNVESYELPLPISLHDLLSLILPHLKQIEKYATFRRDYAELMDDMGNGTIALGDFETRMEEIGRPIPEYNAIIGLWGQPEARAQRFLVMEACEKYGVGYPVYPPYDALRKNRIFDEMVSTQLKKDYMHQYWRYQYTCAFGEEETERLMDEMVRDGILEKHDDYYALSNWEEYIYNYYKY